MRLKKVLAFAVLWTLVLLTYYFYQVTTMPKYLLLQEDLIADGISMQKQRYANILAGAYVLYKKSNYITILPRFHPGVGAPSTAEGVYFDEIVDYSAFIQNFTLGHFAVPRPPQPTSHWYNFQPNPEMKAMSFEEVANLGKNLEESGWFLKAMLMHPSKEILKKVDILKGLLVKSTGKESFTCLHMRTEYDFKSFFVRPPGYYSVPSVVTKMCASIFMSSLKSVLYITGNHITLDEIRGEFKKQCPNSFVVTSKRELDVGVEGTASKSESYISSVDAEVDRVMCTMADSFVGNNHSAWSELIYDFFLWAGRTLEDVMQYNDVDEAMHFVLFPFCSPNAYLRHGIMCKYYRTSP